MSEEYSEEFSSYCKCDICGAPATVHLTQIVDGKMHKVHLCEKCAAKSKVAELPILKFTEILAKTLAAGGKKATQELSDPEDIGRFPNKVCPACGMTDIVLKKKHLIGCSRCYEIFSEEIDALLPEIQPGRDYRGDAAGEKNSPAPAAEPECKIGSLEELRRLLKTAVSKEDYARATTLRDKIRRAEKRATAGETSAKKKRSRTSAGTKKSSGKAKQ